MGKLTKAERDTLVKRTQEAKTAAIWGIIATVLGGLVTIYFWLDPKGLNEKGKIAFFIMIIATIVAFICTINSSQKYTEYQDKLDKDSE